MEVILSKAPDAAYSYVTKPSVINQPEQAGGSSNASTKSESTEPVKQMSSNQKLTQDDIEEITSKLNKFMESFNADVHFAIHDRTGRMMVQVVDTKANRVLKEFPSHELLDTLANIRDYIGILLDKKA